MSGSCCGGSAKSEPNKVATKLATQETEAVAEKSAANKDECCSSEKIEKNEKHSCGC